MMISMFKHMGIDDTGRWTRHIAVVPKGFLRYYILELLDKRPLSGSEIMKEIEKRTGGLWRPSPGSVYPLLMWLQDNKYVEEAPSEEIGIKRYTLTEEGRLLLKKLREEFKEGRKLFIPHPLGAFWFTIPPERAREFWYSIKLFFKTLFNVSMSLKKESSEKALQEIVEVLKEASRRLNEIRERLERVSDGQGDH